MRILYGVVGEGMGHAIRSRVLLEELVKSHEVQVVASGRAQPFLAARFPNVHPIWGLTIQYEHNAVRNVRTFVENAKGALRGWPHNVRTYLDLVRRFRPDVVVSDFESFAFYVGKNLRVPVVSVDNMQVINRCEHPPEVLAGFEGNFELIRSIVKGKLPGCFHYLVTSFFFPRVRKERTTLVPSILRPEILAARAEAGEHLVVYTTSESNTDLPHILRQTRLPCRIYGLRRGLAEPVVEDNLTYLPFSEERFVEDLRTARGVVAGGGFTLMSEAVYLRKPLLSVPVVGQFEQTLNARYLEQLGYGMYVPKLSAEAVAEFLRRIPAAKEKLQGYAQDGNTVALAALKETLQRASQYKGKWAEWSRES
ncbi:MAG: teichoic acid biosynthesis protein [Deltaproteobacteria bacterium]|nr:teichoic acid biosynthesis protein [Deltaproteobacteria bacterium]